MFAFAADVISAATVVCRCQFEMILLFVAVGLGVAVLFFFVLVGSATCY